MSKYIDGTRIVYFDDSTGNLTIPGRLNAASTFVSNDSGGTIAANFVHYDTVAQQLVYNQTGGGGGSGSLNASTVTTILDVVAGGHLLGQETSQIVDYDFTTFGQTWALAYTGFSYANVALSATGKYQCAILQGGQSASPGVLSSNFGQTFTLINAAGIPLTFTGNDAAISASGQYIYIGDAVGQLYSSSDYGNTFALVSSSIPMGWMYIACSADGKYVLGTPNTGNYPQLSSDFGTTWTSILTYLPQSSGSCAVSATGQYMLVGISSNGGGSSGYLQVSSNFGVTWSPAASYTDWSSVSVSGNGRYMTAVQNFTQFWYSNNYGTTWTSGQTVISPGVIGKLGMDFSGRYQVVAASGIGIYYSTDYGVTWSIQPIGTNLLAGAGISANAQYMITGDNSTTELYKSSVPTLFPAGATGVVASVQSTFTSLFATTVTTTNLKGPTTIAPFGYSFSTQNLGDYVTTQRVSNLNVAGNDFTIECYYYPTAEPATYGTIFSLNNNSTTQFYLSRGAPGFHGLTLTVPGNSGYVDTYLPLNAWYYLAVVRRGAVMSVFINGNIVFLVPNSYITSENLALTLFSKNVSPPAVEAAEGYIHSLRCITGQALYTGNYTPPTASLTATTVGSTGANAAASITGTVALLTAESSTFIDIGPSSLPLTVNGTPTPVPITSFSVTPVVNLYGNEIVQNTLTASNIVTQSIQWTSGSATSLDASSLNVSSTTIKSVVGGGPSLPTTRGFYILGADTDPSYGSTLTMNYSYDLVNWTPMQNSLVGDNSVAGGTRNLRYLNGLYFAVGYNGNSLSKSPILVSTDGVNWSNPTSFPNPPTYVAGTRIIFEDVVYGNGMYVAAGHNNATYGIVWHSTDGFTWTESTADTGPFYQDPTTSGGGARGIGFGLGVFVVIGAGNVLKGTYYSTDGIRFYYSGDNPMPAGGIGIVSDGTKFILLGPDITDTWRSSTDGINWSSTGFSGSLTWPNNPASIAFNGTYWLATAFYAQTIKYSSDGLNWSDVSTAGLESGSIYARLSWDGTRWFAGLISATTSLGYSYDGSTWTSVIVPNIQLNTSGNMGICAYANESLGAQSTLTIVGNTYVTGQLTTGVPLYGYSTLGNGSRINALTGDSGRTFLLNVANNQSTIMSLPSTTAITAGWNCTVLNFNNQGGGSFGTVWVSTAQGSLYAPGSGGATLSNPIGISGSSGQFNNTARFIYDGLNFYASKL